jgi:hypothetical protein
MGPFYLDADLLWSDIGKVGPAFRSATPYRERGAHDRTNARDGIYRRGGSQMLLALTERTDGGYQAAFDLALYVD